MVAVHWALFRIELALDARPLRQQLAHVAHLATRRPKEGQGRSRPDEDPHIDPLGQLGEEVAQDDWLLPAHQFEVRREEPVRHVDVRAGRSQLARHHRQRLCAVDHDLDCVAGPRRRFPAGPASSVCV
jgi:hypothetical protein